MNSKEQSTDKDYVGHRKRVKDKFLKSFGNDFEDYELLEILLFSSHARADVKPLAKKLLREFGSLKEVIDADFIRLKNIDGINNGAITAIKIVGQIMTRYFKNDLTKKIIIENWKSLLDYCQATLAPLQQEQLRILFLDKNHRLIKDELHQEGSIEKVAIDTIQIVKKALLFSASSIILIHNHPSGNPQPSKADIENTQKISNALKTVGIKVYDHLIIGGSSYYSFKNNGII